MILRALLTVVTIAVILSGCAFQPNSLAANQDIGPSLGAKTQTEIQPTGESKVLMEPVTLYALPLEEFDKKTSEIPNYNNGEITYLTDEQVKSYNEGHSVTLSDPLIRTLLQITNLIPIDFSADKTIDKQLADLGGGYLNKTVSLETTTNIVFTKYPTDMKSNETIVEVQVPKWWTYTVAWRNGQDSDIQIIQKISIKKGST